MAAAAGKHPLIIPALLSLQKPNILFHLSCHLQDDVTDRRRKACGSQSRRTDAHLTSSPGGETSKTRQEKSPWPRTITWESLRNHDERLTQKWITINNCDMEAHRPIKTVSVGWTWLNTGISFQFVLKVHVPRRCRRRWALLSQLLAGVQKAHLAALSQ